MIRNCSSTSVGAKPGTPPALVSRNDNPFSTCWTRPGAIPWASPTGEGVHGLLERFDRLGSAQIVGPHGSGKTTLLKLLDEAMTGRGDTTVRWVLDGRGIATGQYRRPGPGESLLIDGFEQFSAYKRRLLRWRCRLLKVRLLVTTHEPAPLPVLLWAQTSREETIRLFRGLTAERRTPVTEEDVSLCFDRCKGNIREVWFELYDRHERLIRNRRTLDQCPA